MSPAAWTFLPGAPAPRQQSPTTCGSACLVVARLLLDPALARWVTGALDLTSHSSTPPTTPPDWHPTPAQRFSELEQLTVSRTNRMTGTDQPWQLPWPRVLGTPPWGAMNELQRSGSLPGTHYLMSWLRWSCPAALQDAQVRLASQVRAGRPALLYVGAPLVPRHVVLVFRHDPHSPPLVYEPARGSVFPLDELGLGRPGFDIAGWRVPWLVIHPSAQVVVDAAASTRRTRLLPGILRGTGLPEGARPRQEHR